MAYVIQQPGSATNPTNKYRVIKTEEWLKVVHGDALRLPNYGEFDTYDDALVRQEELNTAD